MQEQKIDKSTLGFIGVEFQFKLVRAFFDCPQFFADINPVVRTNYFTVSELTTVIDVLKDFYKKNGMVPSLSAVADNIRMYNVDTPAEAKAFDTIINRIKEVPFDGAGDLESTKQIATNFCKQQELVRAMNKVNKIIENGDFERYAECREIIDRAINISVSQEDYGQHPFDNLMPIFSGEMRVPIPTGIRGLDNEIGGGLAKGELGLICGPSGFGKTTFTTAVSSYAANYADRMNGNQGFKCLQIFFEDTYAQIKTKYLARELAIECREMKKYYFTQNGSMDDINALQNVPRINKNTIILKLRNKSLSPSELEAKIKNDFINRGFTPDLVTIDYFECLKDEMGTGKMQQHEREEATMRRIEQMVANLNCAVWIATQGTKDSSTADVVDRSKISGSSSKYDIAHIAISITRGYEDVANNKATLFLMKNRAGKSGLMIKDLYFDNGKCRISTEGEDCIEGYESYRMAERMRQMAVLNFLSNQQPQPNQLEAYSTDNHVQDFTGSTTEQQSFFEDESQGQPMPEITMDIPDLIVPPQPQDEELPPIVEQPIIESPPIVESVNQPEVQKSELDGFF